MAMHTTKSLYIVTKAMRSYNFMDIYLLYCYKNCCATEILHIFYEKLVITLCMIFYLSYCHCQKLLHDEHIYKKFNNIFNIITIVLV